MKVMRLKFKDVIEIDKVSLMNYEDVKETIENAIETETKNGVTFYEVGEDDFLIVGNSLEDILKVIFEMFDDFEEVQNLISIITKHIDENINARELTIKVFPHLYTKYLNNKKRRV